MSVDRKRARLILVCACLSACGCRAPSLSRPSQSSPVTASGLVFLAREETSATEEPKCSIWTMNPDGRGRHKIDGSGNADSGAAPSPTGDSFLYLRGDTVHVYSFPEKKTTTLQVRDHPIGIVCWFPDGRRLALSWGGGISTIDVSSGRTANLLRQEDESIVGMAVSPDGRHIAFASLGGISLAEIGATGLVSPRRIESGDSEGFQNGLSWSPDGRFLVHRSTVHYSPIASASENRPEAPVSSLWVYDMTTRNSAMIHSPSQNLSAAFWADADKLAFSTCDLNTMQSNLYVSRLLRGEWTSHRIMTEEGVLSIGGWSRSDAGLFSYALADGEGSRIYVADSDGANRRAISPAEARDESPRWLR